MNNSTPTSGDTNQSAPVNLPFSNSTPVPSAPAPLPATAANSLNNVNLASAETAQAPATPISTANNSPTAPINPSIPTPVNTNPAVSGSVNPTGELSPTAPPSPHQPQAPQKPLVGKKELPLPAIIAIMVVLLIILGVIIYLTVVNKQAEKNADFADTSSDDSEVTVSHSSLPPVSSMTAVLAKDFSRSLDMNCVASGQGKETIAWAELPFSLSSEIKQNFNLLLADSVDCTGQVDLRRQTIAAGTRYVLLANPPSSSNIDRFYFVHANSTAATSSTQVTDNVLAFPHQIVCNQSNLCYHSPQDNLEIYLNSEDGSNYYANKFCVTISNQGKLSNDNSLLAKAYVGECFALQEFPQLYELFTSSGKIDLATYTWQANARLNYGDFYRQLTNIYKSSARFQALLERLQTLTAGVSFN